jgi:hypothetical protein
VLGRPQVNTDALAIYQFAVSSAFEGKVDHGRIRKVYGRDQNKPDSRYSPPECIAAEREAVSGNPDMAHVSTSYVERANLTMRMGMRRYTRLTNGHSKKLKQHECMLGIFFTYYNLCRKHETLEGRTPAMAAGIASHVWTVEELVNLMPQANLKLTA